MSEKIIQELLFDVNVKDIFIYDDFCLTNYNETKLMKDVGKKSELCYVDGLNHILEYRPESNLCKLTYDKTNEDLILTIEVVKSIKYYHKSQENKVRLIYKTKKLHYKSKEKKLMLYDNTKLNKGSVRELTFKDLKQQIFRFISDFNLKKIVYNFIALNIPDENKLFYKDIKKEILNGDLWIPVKVSDLYNNIYYNKRDFLLKKYKWKTPRSANKYELVKSVLIFRAKKYIQENMINKFWEMNICDINDYDIDFRKNKEIALKMYCTLIKNQFDEAEIEELEEVDYFLIDYINMSFDLSLYPNTNIKTLSNLIKNHEKVMVEYNEKQFNKKQKRSIKITNENSKFNDLKLPNKFIKIEYEKELYQEGVVQHHCVYSYLNKVLKDKCVIYTCIHKNKKYTIEIINKKRKFVLFQVMGRFNTSAPESLIQELEILLQEENNKKKKKRSKVV